MTDSSTDPTAPHPLDGTDPDQCYQIMMNERSILITARRESEDNLIKNIISLSSAMIVLMAGFTTQAEIEFSSTLIILFCFSLALSLAAIVFGMLENYFSSRAYLKQQALVEQFYSKVIAEFCEPNENKYVRRSQFAAFASFLISLLLIGAFSINVLIGTSHVQKSAAPAAPAAPASAATPAAAREVSADTVRRQDEISGTVDAAATAKKVIDAPRCDE